MTVRMVSVFIGLSVIASLTIFSCQEPERPEPYPHSDLVLEKLDASCTEAWLKISLTRVDSPATQSIPIVLTRDGEAVQSFAFTPPETLVVDAGLEPAHSYQYQAQRRSVHDNQIIASSNTLSLTTLDTTSHDFTWTIDTLGDYGSYFNDVAIIDENNIWAVGMIRTDSADYNAAHWDGDQWEMARIAPPPFLFAQLTSIYAISAAEIWLAGTAPMKFDGEIWNAETTFPTSGWINAIWGSSPEDVWFVGSGGSIVHYDGSGFTRMESGTDVDLLDIDGASDGEHVFARGYDETVPSQNIILEYDRGQWETIYYIEGHYYPEPGDYGHIEGIGIFQDFLYISAVAGLWRYNYQSGESVLVPNQVTGMGNGAFIDIHINAFNDIYFDGAGFKYVHYNGSSYYYGHELYDMYSQRANHGSAYNGDLVVVVGFFNGYHGALIARGYHE